MGNGSGGKLNLEGIRDLGTVGSHAKMNVGFKDGEVSCYHKWSFVC